MNLLFFMSCTIILRMQDEEELGKSNKELEETKAKLRLELDAFMTVLREHELVCANNTQRQPNSDDDKLVTDIANES